MMQIAATILSGNSEGLIGEAIGSVREWVDWILLIDTGITDGTVAVAREAAGAKLIVERFAWCNDFALARNFALAKAAELGAAWALTVDTDERLSFPGFATPEQLRAALDADAAVLAWLHAEPGREPKNPWRWYYLGWALQDSVHPYPSRGKIR